MKTITEQEKMIDGVLVLVETKTKKVDILDAVMLIVLIIAATFISYLIKDNQKLLNEIGYSDGLYNEINSSYNNLKRDYEALQLQYEELNSDYEYAIDVMRSTDRYYYSERFEKGLGE